LAGSLLGIAAYSVLSFAWAPSYVWGSLTALAFILLIDGRQRWLAAAAGLGLVASLAVESVSPG
jgi:hypothetical protein